MTALAKCQCHPPTLLQIHLVRACKDGKARIFNLEGVLAWKRGNLDVEMFRVCPVK